MKTIIAGSRDITDYQTIDDAMNACGWLPTAIISGAARGVDTLGETWGETHGILIYQFPAEWDKYGKSAGYKRNEQMAKYAQALVAIWDGKSRGTKHMIDIATKAGLTVYIHRVD
jgi:hypothetical protein